MMATTMPGRPLVIPAVTLLTAATLTASAYAFRNYSNRPVRDDSFRTLTAASDLLAADVKGNTIAAGGWDRRVTIWDASTGERLRTFTGHTDRVMSVALSSTGLVASGSKDATAQIWDVRKGHLVQLIDGHRDRVRAVAFSPDGTLLATGSRDATVKVWTVASGQELASMSDNVWITHVEFSPDGRSVAFGAVDGKVGIWDYATPSVRVFAKVGGGVALTFSLDGRQLVSGSGDGVLRVWDVERGVLLSATRGSGPITDVAYSPQGDLLATASTDRTIRVWDVKTGSERTRFIGHGDQVHSVRFTHDGGTLGSTSDDETVKLWRLSRE
jgi:WD40 repeat protein